MTYNFNEQINRQNTNSLKYDFAARFNKPINITPLWVADMDFKIPPEVTEKLQSIVNHGIYGYTDANDDYFNALYNWFDKIHGYKIKKEWLVKTPGIVYALGMAIKAFTAPNDSILIQKPLYYPIENTIVANGRKAIDNTLKYSNNCYSIDITDFEEKIIKHNIKMFILCNPHNPVGRVWTKEELQEMGRICKKHNVLVVSDEIHCDIVFGGHKHLVFSNVCEDVDSIICTAPSKTFNLAGLQCSNIFIANKKLKAMFKHEIHATGYSQLNTMALAAGQAAYEHGGAWHTALMEYLTSNALYVKSFIEREIPQIKVIDLQGSYLMWLDFSGFNLSHNELDDIITNKAKLWLSSGTTFGETGQYFFRINLACPLNTLEKAMAQLKGAFK